VVHSWRTCHIASKVRSSFASPNGRIKRRNITFFGNVRICMSYACQRPSVQVIILRGSSAQTL
jgi:hypothetical protein